MAGSRRNLYAEASPERKKLLSGYKARRDAIKRRLLEGNAAEEIEKLVQALKRGDENRDLAAMMLGEIGYSSKNVLGVLGEKAISDTDWIVRHNCLEALGLLGGADEILVLVEAMEGDSQYVCRRAAIMSLEKICGKPGVDANKIDELLETRFGKKLDELTKLKDIPPVLAEVRVVANHDDEVEYRGTYLVDYQCGKRAVLGRLEHDGRNVWLVTQISDDERKEALEALEAGIDARVFVKKETNDALEATVRWIDFAGKKVDLKERIIIARAPR